MSLPPRSPAAVGIVCNAIIIYLGSASERAKGWGAVWAKSGHLAPNYYRMSLAGLGMGEGEGENTSARSRAYLCHYRSLILLVLSLSLSLSLLLVTFVASSGRSQRRPFKGHVTHQLVDRGALEQAKLDREAQAQYKKASGVRKADPLLLPGFRKGPLQVYVCM